MSVDVIDNLKPMVIQLDTSVTIELQTEEPTLGYVQYGKSPEKLDQKQEIYEATTNHRVFIMGLEPEVKYYYQFVLKTLDGRELPKIPAKPEGFVTRQLAEEAVQEAEA